MEIKLCECGCGAPSPIAKQTRKEQGHIKDFPMRFINHHNCVAGETAPGWKGGRRKTSDGNYDLVYCPNHPKAQSNGCVLSHRLRVEVALGKILSDKIPVHHHSEMQLVACEDDAYHKLLHQRTRALRTCGHANWRKCWICKKYDSLENLTKYGPINFYHKGCLKEYKRGGENMNSIGREIQKAEGGT